MKTTINKKTISLISLLGFFLFQINAQNLTPTKASVEHNESSRACWEVHIDPEPKSTKKAWEDFLKDEYDFHIKGIGFLTNKDLLSAEEVVVEAISSKKIDFYTQIVEDENGTEMKVFAAFGYDVYIDEESHPAAFKALKTITENFVKTYLPKYHQGLIAETTSRLEELKKEEEDLNKDISNNKEDIEELNKEIEELNEELETNQSMLNDTKLKLEKRNLKLERVKKALKQI